MCLFYLFFCLVSYVSFVSLISPPPLWLVAVLRVRVVLMRFLFSHFRPLVCEGGRRATATAAFPHVSTHPCPLALPWETRTMVVVTVQGALLRSAISGVRK